MHDFKSMVDHGAAISVLAVVVDWLPAAVSVLAIIWYSIRIYEYIMSKINKEDDK